MAATKVYEIADGTAITSKGVILVEGQEVTKDDFLSEEVFNKLVKAKKIVEVTKASGKKASDKKASDKSDEPSSSTGAVDAGAEDTKPKSDSKDDSDKGGDTGDDAGDAQ